MRLAGGAIAICNSPRDAGCIPGVHSGRQYRGRFADNRVAGFVLQIWLLIVRICGRLEAPRQARLQWRGCANAAGSQVGQEIAHPRTSSKYNARRSALSARISASRQP